MRPNTMMIVSSLPYHAYGGMITLRNNGLFVFALFVKLKGFPADTTR